MAGSWKHFTDGAGRFIGSELLENGGDVLEALEEAYGMVWFLADQLSAAPRIDPVPGQWSRAIDIVEIARQHYKDGLQVSPGFTLRAAHQNINWDKAWGENRRAFPDTEED